LVEQGGHPGGGADDPRRAEVLADLLLEGLGLEQQRGEARFRRLALVQVAQDHRVLFFLIEAANPEDIAAKLYATVTTRIPQSFGFHPVEDIQVLAPMNRGGLGVQAINLELQRLLNPTNEPRVQKFGTTYAPGDKVLQRVNNYDKEVFNGDIGRIRGIDLEKSVVTVDFDSRAVEYEIGELDELGLAYAASIHKSQGSEYPVVVIPLAMQHYRLLERNLLYTAVTRGKKLVVIIAEPKALRMAVRRQESQRRITRLAERLGATSGPVD
jgi:exodeoxyribonuclease V alpha subunit